MLTTLLPPTSGTATVAGFDIVRQAAARAPAHRLRAADALGRRRADRLREPADLREALRHPAPRAQATHRRGARVHGARRRRATAWCASYSGGMIRRLEIAQSMLHRPRVLFLDEPTVGLDPIARHAVWEHIVELRAEFDTTIFLTTHLTWRRPTRSATRSRILHRGTLAALGAPAGAQGGARPRARRSTTSSSTHGPGLGRIRRDLSRRRHARAAPPAASAEASRTLAALPASCTRPSSIAELEVRKLRHDPTELFTRAVQPALWLLVFGQVFTRSRAIPTGGLPYLDFMAPGILAQSVLFVAIFYGIAGHLGARPRHRSTSCSSARRRAPRWCSARRSSAGVRGLSQVVIVYTPRAAARRAHRTGSRWRSLGVRRGRARGAGVLRDASR